MFTQRRVALFGVAYATIVALLVFGYPTIRHVLLRRVYLGVELASLVVAVGCLIAWYFGDGPRRVEHLVAGVIVGLEAAMLTGGPYRGIVFLAWDRAWAILLILYPALILIEGWVWSRQRASGLR